MNKGISFYFGYTLKPEETVKSIKQAGFDCVITSTDKRYDKQNGSLKKQVALFKKYKLKLSSLHGTYDKVWSKFLWQKNLKGYIVYRKLLKDIKLAKKYGFNSVVIHLYGEPSEIGLKRIKKVLKYCAKVNIPLAIENIRNNTLLDYVFANIKSESLKFCYDIGHNNVFTPNEDLLDKYGDKLYCLHLHDNMGEKDDHTLNKYGSIDWNKFANKLKELKFNGNLDYEILMNYRKNETYNDVLKQVFNQAKKLEKLLK